MGRQSKNVVRLGSTMFPRSNTVIGILADLTVEGVPLVEVPGISTPVLARTAVQLRGSECDCDRLLGSEVLLHVNEHDPLNVIIIGLVSSTMWAGYELNEKSELPHGGGIDAEIDGRTVSLNAKNAIALTCGKSMIVLRKDGTILIKGIKISSRAARTNRIKGASVSIN